MTKKDMITRTSFVKKTLSHIELHLESADLKDLQNMQRNKMKIIVYIKQIRQI
jgi:hypothetical protein